MIGGELLAWGLDPMHLLFFGFIALLLFGRRLPEVGRSLGRGIMEFKRGLRDVSDDMDRADDEDRRKQSKLKSPADNWLNSEDADSESKPRRERSREPQHASNTNDDKAE